MSRPGHPTTSWASCASPGCSYRRCLSLDSAMCFKHTPGNEHVKHWKIMARVGLDPSTVG